MIFLPKTMKLPMLHRRKSRAPAEFSQSLMDEFGVTCVSDRFLDSSLTAQRRAIIMATD